MSEQAQRQQQRKILLAYGMLLLTVFCIVPLLLAYFFAFKVSQVPDTEVWLQSHALWISRHVIIFGCMAAFAGLWFIPLGFVAWNSHLLVNATTIIGVIFAVIAWLFLLNALLKGFIRYLQRKSVY